MPRLVVLTPDFEKQTCPLPDGDFMIGRKQNNDIVFADSTVSGTHCSLHIYWNEVIVRDRSSRNGVFVDGVRVKGQKGVRYGQVIRLGRVEISVVMSEKEDRDATAHTAVDELRRLELKSATVTPQTFPVIFESTSQ